MSPLPELLSPQIFKFSPEILEKAAQHILTGHLVALPTETVYGIAADATQDAAVQKIFYLKKRPSFNPLIIHCSDIEMARTYTLWNEKAEKLAAAFWPGPLTFILNKKNTAAPLSSLASAHLTTLAVRIPNHPIVLSLIKKVGRPLAMPSANPSQAISPTCSLDVLESFQEKSGFMIIEGGKCQGGLESTIIDLTTDSPCLLRPGLIHATQIEEILDIKVSLSSSSHSSSLKAPGQMKRHYAPQKPLRLNATNLLPFEGLLAFGKHSFSSENPIMNLSTTGDVEEAAYHLFSLLRLLDASPVKQIAVMPIPLEGVGVAINDRLLRAATPEN